MKLIPESNVPIRYDLLSVEVNFVHKVVLIRYAPTGHPNPLASPHLRLATVRNEPLAPDPGNGPDRPTDEELADPKVAARYDRELSEHQLRNRERVASEAVQHFDAWIADGRDIQVKAGDYFDRHYLGG